MQCNVGGSNCTFRVLFGLVLLVMGFYSPLGMFWQSLTVLTGTFLLVTGLLRFCPIGALFRRHSCPPEQRKPG